MFCIYVAVNFLFQLIFIFPLFWGMVMYANEFKTKEKQKLTATYIYWCFTVKPGEAYPPPPFPPPAKIPLMNLLFKS